MAGFYIVTGKLGNGKTLVTVGRIRDAILKQRRVVTNLDINLRAMFGRKAKDIELIRIPDKPTVHDLEAVGVGYDGPYDESKFGVLVLDECGTWFNSRNWQDKSRKAVNDWFLHARKLKWECYLIIQNESILDSQARDALMEYVVYCHRLDNVRLPFVVVGVASVVAALVAGFMFSVSFGLAAAILTFIFIRKVKLPRVHVAKVMYSDVDMLADRWVYRGTDLFACYDTAQLFLADYPHGPHCVLPPWHTHGRFSVPMNLENIMRITRIYWKRFKSPVALTSGLLAGAFIAFLVFAQVPDRNPVQSLPEPSEANDLQGEPLQEPSIVGKLRELRITGSMSINGQYHYQLAGIQDEGYLTEADLAQAGVTISRRGSCRLDAYYDSHHVPIFCL